MSRAANVTLTFTGDLTQVDQSYEAFVRKVTQPLKVPLTVDATGAGGVGASTTTFATGNVPGATPAAGGGADSGVVAAMDRLTSALSRQTDPGSPARRARPAFQPLGGGEWGPGENFNANIDALGVPAANDPGRGRRGGRRGLQQGRFITQYLILYEAGQLALAAQQEGIEERLSVNAGGGTDLSRQFRAQKAFQSRVEGIPIVGQIAGFVAGLTGIGEGTERTLDDAARQDRATGLRQQGYDYIRTSKERDYVSAGEGERLRAIRSAQIEDVRATRQATELRSQQVDANAAAGNFDTTGPDAFLAVAKREIGRGYDQTLKDIAKQYTPIFNRLSAELPALAQESVGNFRAADEIRLRADVQHGIESELDPAAKILKQAAGESTIANFISKRGITEGLIGSELADLTLSFSREATGDQRGSLVARQRARRTAAVGPESDDPNRAARGLAQDAQSAGELRAYDLSQTYLSSGLAADERVSGLLAQRRPIGAQVEGIYSRGTARAEGEVDQGRDQNALSIYRTTQNQLEALRNEILLGGQGVQVGAGAYGPGGTEGSGQENVIKALEDLGAKMDAVKDAIQGLSQD